MSKIIYRKVGSVTELNKNGYEVVQDGLSISYYWNGLLHRGADLPAYEDFNGTLKWYVEGELHREAGPAVIHKHSTIKENDIKVYYLRGSQIEGKNLEDFIKFTTCSLKDLPLYINHPLLKDIVAHRLKDIKACKLS